MSFQQHYGRGSEAKGMHFYLTILPHELQDQEHMVPRNFVEKYWKGVSNPISLKFPNDFECKMNWVLRGNDIWLLNWKKFARSLRCGDLLVFQYTGGSDFHVIILDDSKLEIDYSSMQCNDDQDSNKHYKLEESDDNDCVEILNDIATTSAARQGTNIYKRKINMNATKQKVSVDEGAEATEEGESCDDEATEEVQESDGDESSDESSYDEDEIPKQARQRTRNGKRKVSMDFDTTQPKFSDSEGHKVMKHNTFKIYVNNCLYPVVPNEFMKRGCHENLVELKIGIQSWFIKVNYYPSIRGCRFGKGWRNFVGNCKVKFGNTCLLELIDKDKFVFKVSIVR